MLALNDLRSILDQAEQAVAREDYAVAERLLREALTIQELNSGKRDEVAKTLNNLAIVCEMAGKVPDAEACYRRAYEIAEANLPASDPFVKTSRDNLEEFCRDRGLPMSRPAPPAPPPPAPSPAQTLPRHQSGIHIPSPPPKTAGFVPSAPRSTPSAPPASGAPPSASATAPPPAAPPRAQTATPPPPAASASRPAARQAPPPPAAPPMGARQPQASPRGPQLPPRVASPVPPRKARSSRASLFVVLGLASFIAVIAGGRYLFRPELRPQPTDSAPATSADPTAATPAPVGESPTPTPPSATEPPVPTPPPPTPEPTAPPPIAAAPEKPAATEKPTGAARGAANLNVLNADLCRSLSTSGAWRCTPATGPQSPGTLTFYTRVAAPRDTTIEHRWYRGDMLHQRVPLRIRPNPSGYRTFSRTRISADRTGDWRVELRNQDGEVLETKTFVIK